MNELIGDSTANELNKAAEYLRDVIVNAADQFIPKQRPCDKSKVWWSNELTRLRKQMAHAKRLHKSNNSNENFLNFKKYRNEYFHAIRSAKNKSWTNFLENAIGKEVFQAYKFTKSNRIEKLPPIRHNNKTHIEFNDKCDAFIEAMYLPPPVSDRILKYSNSNVECPKLIESEIRNAIFSLTSNKTPDFDQLSFLINQKTYSIIS
ncbi:MAG: hypothetical protein ICV61_20835, partial [Microcoleus sp. Co-bin12]|nr:hypothetical protein [Microcoleus sp. Co-bin12]